METVALVFSLMAVVAAIASALFAWQQVRVGKSAAQAQALLTIVDYLQRPDHRDSRRVVLNDLQQLPVSEWSDQQRAAASNVCASYDLVGSLLRAGVVEKDLILQSYGASIIRCHETCSPLVEQFRARMAESLRERYWDDFDWLDAEARKLFDHAGPGSLQPISASASDSS